MLSKKKSRFLARLAAALATTATFEKSFVPFYLIGSTTIFAVTCVSGIILVAISWREIYETAKYANDVLIVTALLYGVVIVSYLTYSLQRVPVTYLIGIFAFHALFLLFGFAAARSLKAVAAVLLAQAATYLIVVAQYTARFGDLMRDGYLHDIFGIGISSMFVTTFHQQIGNATGLALLATFGLWANRTKLLTFVVLPLVLLFLFHIAARAAIVALVCGFIFLMGADLWTRSRKGALLSLSVLFVLAAFASGLFYERSLHDKDVDPVAPDAISRTIREIQSQDPDFRLNMWSRAWHRIATEPDRLVFGRGIGAYPIDEGFGPPDWLLNTKSVKYYPHNTYLEMLYETGTVGWLIFSVLTLIPLGVALKHWSWFSAQERSAISLYVFYFASLQFAGSFAYSYDFEFFFALATGVICLKRREFAESDGLPSRSETLVPA
jgi:O-antigen ligase